MTLPRSNPGRGRAVIDRNDDSRRVHVAAIGGPSILLDVLISALGVLHVDAWRVDPGPLQAPADGVRLRSADVVLLDLSTEGYSSRSRALIRRLAREGWLTVVLDRDARPRLGRRAIEAGALWAVNPRSITVEDLADVVHRAAITRRNEEDAQRRAHLARQAWDEAIGAESSILTMRPRGERSQYVADRSRRRTRESGVAPTGLTGGEQGRQA